MRSQIERFARWRRRVPKNTAYLIDLALEEVVPMLEARGYGRHPDYAGNSAYAVGLNCLPLQRRSGAEWPMVEILFDPRMRPSLAVAFATLPERCVRLMPQGAREIPRAEANVVEGRGFFSLCKGTQRNLDCNYGYLQFAFRPKRRLEREVTTLRALAPWMLDLLDRGIPDAWYPDRHGRVDRHAFFSLGALALEQRMRRGSAQA